MSPFFTPPVDPSPTPHVSESGPNSGADVALAISTRLRAAGLTTPAALLLRALRPAYWLGGQMLYVAQPFLESLGMGSTRKHSQDAALSPSMLARFFENEKDVDSLLRTLENPPAGPLPSSKGESHENR